MSRLDPPSVENDFLYRHIAVLRDSYRHWTRRELAPPGMDDKAAARYLYAAPFALLSHDTAREPVFNYANQTALNLFAMGWEELTSLPSRLSAEPVLQDERQRLLEEVTLKGYIDHYEGIRIGRHGRRFSIHNAVVWNLTDRHGEGHLGQAAMFKDWRFL